MERTQFTFYESFYKALSRIRKDADRAKAYDAITRFALYGEDPDLDAMPDNVAIAFEVIRPNMEASRRKSEAGRKGGESKRKQTVSKAEANKKQIGSKRQADGSKPEANAKQDKEQVQVQGKEQDKDKEQMLLPPTSSNEEVPPFFSGGKQKKFVPPTVEEVEACIQERGYSVDPEAFVAFYASKGWKVGAAPMKDWRAALVTWEKRGGRNRRTPTQAADTPVDEGDLDWLLAEMAVKDA